MSKNKQAQNVLQSKLTQEELIERYIYDHTTGAFYKRKRFDGLDSSNGYRKLQFYKNGERFHIKAHRAAWLYMTGEWPEEHIDHINLDRGDNSWDNLREATHAENLSNVAMFKSNTSGFKGVSWRKDRCKWYAYIGHQNKKISLGFYDTPEEAYEAYCKAAIDLHGNFHRLK